MTEVQTFEAKASAASPRHTLESLARLDVDALGPVYAAGTVPASLAVLDGHPRGRMLAVRALDHGGVASALRSFSGATAFPWGGKSFASRSATEGTGINRVHLFGRHQLFPFHTHVGASAIDGRSTIVLDYDLPDNPSVIRHIHDEIREVSPGLFLGPAMWKAKGAPAFVLWFALDTNTQAKPIGAR
jgi:hypothetical protein